MSNYGEEHSEPAWARLGGGLTNELLRGAVETSGYPLQTIAARRFGQTFQLQPEWGFRDRTTGEMRAIDFLATKDLSEGDPNAKRVRPRVAIIVECKQSSLPYVFFGGDFKALPEFPMIGGLPSSDITIRTDDDRSTWSYPAVRALGLAFEDFVLYSNTAVNLSKVVWKKGGDVELSGSDAYRSTVLPVISAIDHFRTVSTPKTSFVFFDAILVLGLVILDAPMVLATVDDKGESVLEPTAWARLWRHEPPILGSTHQRDGNRFAIDFVHVEYLSEYLEKHLGPFASKFAQQAMRHDIELATSQGFAAGMGADSWTGIERRLQPSKVLMPPPPINVPPDRLGKTVAALVKDIVRTRVSSWRLRRAQKKR